MKTILAFAALVVVAAFTFVNTSAFEPKSAQASTGRDSVTTVIHDGSFTVDLPESSSVVWLAPMTVTGRAPQASHRAPSVKAPSAPSSHSCTRANASSMRVGQLIQESGAPVLMLDCR